MQAAVTVHGRALARNGSVTLINDHFTTPTCATAITPPTTTAPGAGAPGAATPPTTIAPGAGTPGAGIPATTTTLGVTVGVVGPPVTGVAPLAPHEFPWPAVLIAGFGGTATLGLVVRRRLHAHLRAQPNGAPRSRS
jgi:hypothetical protein